MPVYGVERPRQLGFQGVYRVPAGGGAPQLLVDRHLFDQPNGLCFSPDEKLLYVNDTEQTLIRVFDVAADGSLSNGRVFATGIRSSLEPGRARRHEMRPARQRLGDRARRRLGLCAVGRSARQGARRPRWSPISPGAARISARCSDRDPFGLSVATKVGPRREPYMSARRGRAARLASAGAARRAAAAAPRRDLTARSAALRADHPGHAERRDQRGRRLRRAPARPPTRARSASSRTSAASPRPRGRAASPSSMSGSSSSRARRA